MTSLHLLKSEPFADSMISIGKEKPQLKKTASTFGLKAVLLLVGKKWEVRVRGKG